MSTQEERDFHDSVSKTHTESDLTLYTSKVESLRLEVETCDQDIKDAQTNIDGWTRTLTAAHARRERLVHRFRAARIAQRAAEDANDVV